MDEKKTKVTKKIEDTMACSAFAEAGEPCPIDEEEKDERSTTHKPSKGEKKTAAQSIEDTMACSAFAEAGEPCPIDSGKKRTKKGTKK